MEPIKSSGKELLNKRHIFNPRVYLASGGFARIVAKHRRSEKVYSQGDPATSVIYIEKGGVKMSVVNAVGKEAVVAMLGPDDFFGEG
jgi:CRP/FNR family cyclic AMP-dependent transcriptional regulator